jgi:hypothetical protein
MSYNEINDNNQIDNDNNQIDNDNDYKMFYKEDISVIKLAVIYVNKENQILKIKEELLPLSSKNCLLREDLLRIIKDNAILNNIKYSILSLLVYNITLDPENLFYFLKSNENKNYLRSIHNIDTIRFEPSMNIFNDINQLILILNETHIKNNNTSHNVTKKIYINANRYYNNHTKTKRK